MGQARRLEVLVEQEPVGRRHPGDDGDAVEVHRIRLQAGQDGAHGLPSLLVRVRDEDDPGRDGLGHVRRRRRRAEDGLQLFDQPAEGSVAIGISRDAEDRDHLRPGGQGLEQGEVRTTQPAGQVEDHRPELVQLSPSVPDGRGRQDEQVMAVEVALQAFAVVPEAVDDRSGPGAALLQRPELGVGGLAQAGEGERERLLHRRRCRDLRQRRSRLDQTGPNQGRTPRRRQGAPIPRRGERGGEQLRQLGQGQGADVGQAGGRAGDREPAAPTPRRERTARPP